MLARAAMISIALAAGATSAQEEDARAPGQQPQPFTPAEREITATLSLSAELITSADFEDIGGDVGVTRVGSALDLNIPAGRAANVTVRLDTEHSFYDFEGVGLIPGTPNPVEDVHQYGISGRIMAPFSNNQLSWLGGLGVSSAGESGADFSKTLTYHGLAGLIYHVDREISIGGAIVVRTQLEDSTLIVPVPIFRWRFDENWMLATEGPRVELTYDTGQSLVYGAYIAWENRSFRLDGGGPSPDAVITENRIPVGAFVTWSASPGLMIRGEVFGGAYTNYEARSDSEVTLGEDGVDPAIGVGITAVLRF